MMRRGTAEADLQRAVVPPAPAVADPMLTTVVEPDAPPVPRFTVLVTPVVVAPVPMP